MKRLYTIQKIISALLICLLVFGITPIRVFHDILTDHIDKNSQHQHKHQSEIAKASFNCHIEGFVADKNYTYTIDTIGNYCLSIHNIYQVRNTKGFYSQHHFYAELRGPPLKA